MLRPIRRALLSVSDKTGLVDFARELVTKYGVELIATGGTRKALANAGLPVKDISELTKFPEILDGRVKTLHPAIYAGLLAKRDKPEHMRTLTEHGLPEIDLVVCNLYPFEETVAKPNVTEAEAIENIDIGGPCMVRAAAKNYMGVAILTSPDQYDQLLVNMDAEGRTNEGLRAHLAAAAFARIAAYDRAISDYFLTQVGNSVDGSEFESAIQPSFAKTQNLRYGENPHQKAAFYVEPGITRACLATAQKLHGKELSYNNILDLDSALNLAREFAGPACVVVKHNNPCGAATAAKLADAFQQAWDGDALSAFGGIIAFNRMVDAATAKAIVDRQFVEVVLAPGYEDEALKAFAKKANVRVLEIPAPADGDLSKAHPGNDVRRVGSGLLIQTADRAMVKAEDLKIVTKRAPTPAEIDDLIFAWKVAKYVKSNAIVYAKNRQTIGVGAGQMSRVYSAKIAGIKAADEKLEVRGSVMASDAFFPFRDGLDAAAAAGISAVIQPGGSMRDAEVIAAADEHGMAMVFTGIRHFRH